VSGLLYDVKTCAQACARDVVLPGSDDGYDSLRTPARQSTHQQRRHRMRATFRCRPTTDPQKCTPVDAPGRPHLALFSSVPPYLSVRWLVRLEMNWASR
jgi:hypothetical protein